MEGVGADLYLKSIDYNYCAFSVNIVLGVGGGSLLPATVGNI